MSLDGIAYPRRVVSSLKLRQPRSLRAGVRLLGFGGGHTPGLAVIAALCIWLCHRLIVASAIPAGTDMFGFVTRSRQNASLSELLSPWAPSSLGAIRQITLDNLLGAVTLATGSPFVTVKLLIVATLFAAGGFAYALSWRWYRRRVAAAFAGVLYMTSQASLTRWGSGELNVEMALATAPLLVLLWSRCLDCPTTRRIAAIAIAYGFVLFVRIDMALYVAPFLALQCLVRITLSPRPRGLLARATGVAGIVATALCVLIASQILPALAGIRASWLTTASLFDRDQFASKSLDLYPSLLGFGREIGYLAFTGQETWLSHPWVPTVVYEGAATVTLLFALAALAWHRGHRTLSLVSSVVVGVFLAKGIRGPIGGPYVFAVTHVPGFGNMRDPNRWLIVPSLGVAVLAGLTLDRLLARLRRALPRSSWFGALGLVAGIALLAVVLLPVAPTLTRGLMTWRAQPAQLALLRAPATDHSQFAVATIPFDQNYRFLTTRGYRGYEHDLGAESATFTGHPALADGGWHQQTADYVAFASTLLARHDPAFARLLGTVGVKYLVDFSYPETAPHLLPTSLELKAHDPSTGTFWQQQAWSAMDATSPLAATSGGSTYRLPGWSPPVSARTNLAVILGGPSGLASLADMPGVHLDRWAAVTAPDALAHGGLQRLLALMKRSNLVVLTGEPLRSVAILATPAFADAPGVTSNPDLDRLTELVPSDQSDRTGSLANSALPAASPGETSVVATLRLPRRQTGEVWARVEASPTAAQLALRLDGRLVGSATPLALQTGAMVWVDLGRRTFAAGTHSVRLSASPSLFGDSYEIDEVRIVDPRALARSESLLSRAVGELRQKEVVALDVNSLPLGREAQGLYRSADVVGPPSRSYWTVLDPEAVRTHPLTSPPPAHHGLRLVISGGRSFYTILQHTYVKPRDWSGRNYVFFTYRGIGSGQTYHLYIDFDRKHLHSASYDVVDSDGGWHTLALSTRSPDHGAAPFAWRHVVSVRLTADSRDLVGRIVVGAVGLSARVHPVAIDIPTPCGIGGKAIVRGSGVDAVRRSCALDLAVDLGDLGPAAKVYAGRPVHELPSAKLAFTRTSPTSYGFAVDSKTPAWLVLDQGYDQHWRARLGGQSVRALPLFSVVNGFPLAAGLHTGTIRFAGTGWVTTGAVISAAALLALVALLVLNPALPGRTRKRANVLRAHRPMPRWSRRRPTYWTACLALAAVVLAGPLSVAATLVLGLAIVLVYRVTWWMCAAAAGVLLVTAPLVAERSGSAANVVALDILFLIACTVGLIVFALRARFERLRS